MRVATICTVIDTETHWKNNNNANLCRIQWNKCFHNYLLQCWWYTSPQHERNNNTHVLFDKISSRLSNWFSLKRPLISEKKRKTPKTAQEFILKSMSFYLSAGVNLSVIWEWMHAHVCGWENELVKTKISQCILCRYTCCWIHPFPLVACSLNSVWTLNTLLNRKIFSKYCLFCCTCTYSLSTQNMRLQLSLSFSFGMWKTFASFMPRYNTQYRKTENIEFSLWLLGDGSAGYVTHCE